MYLCKNPECRKEARVLKRGWCQKCYMKAYRNGYCGDTPLGAKNGSVQVVVQALISEVKERFPERDLVKWCGKHNLDRSKVKKQFKELGIDFDKSLALRCIVVDGPLNDKE